MCKVVAGFGGSGRGAGHLEKDTESKDPSCCVLFEIMEICACEHAHKRTSWMYMRV